MKIAIDCSKAVNEKAGVARYTWEIADNLPKLYPQDRFFYFFNFMRGQNEKIPLIKKLTANAKNIRTKIYKIPGRFKERLLASSYSILNYWLKDFDIYHATEFLSFDHGLKIPQVLTVYDLTMIRFPSHRVKDSTRHGEMLKKACLKAEAILSISQATKDDLIKYFNIDPKKIFVTYLGYNPVFKKIDNIQEIKKILKKYYINYPYILFVGTIEPRKNIANLLKAFDKFKNQDKNNFHLVLIGKKGWNTSEIDETFAKTKYKDKIHFMDFIDDQELVYLYNAASLLCYPSLFEGFGLPVLEAMACGTPVITSNISSLPEVGGDAARYIDPDNIEDISNKITQILTDQIVLKAMSKKSLKQAKKFSWEKCARETYQVYEKVLKDKNA